MVGRITWCTEGDDKVITGPPTGDPPAGQVNEGAGGAEGGGNGR